MKKLTAMILVILLALGFASCGKDEVKELSASLIQVLLGEIANGNSVTIHGLGVFVPSEKASRKMFNPTSKTYIVVPPKTTLCYKMSAALKDKLNME